MGIPEHLSYLLRILYAGLEETVRTGHGTTDGSKLGKENVKAVYCRPAYLTYAEYIMWNAELDEAQAGIKILGWNINNLSYADDINFIAESKSSEVKSLSHVRLFATPWTVAHQVPPPMGFSRQEYWSGLPFPSPGDLPDPGIESRSPALQADALTSEPPGQKVKRN